VTAEAASRVLREVVDAERAALETLDVDDPLAARFRNARAKAEQALASFTRDTADSLSMSPSATIVPTARRMVTETRLLRSQLCD